MPNSKSFIEKHQLPRSYSRLIDKWFKPLTAALVTRKKGMSETLVVGINGAQGSGKSTLANLLVTLFEDEFSLTAVCLSLDDFYYSRQQRKHLADTVHPLLQTRGVPGTHDITLAIDVLQQLSFSRDNCVIPRFNKVTDDRYPETQWNQVSGHVDVIILEGWCLGAQAQTVDELMIPFNELEALEDVDGRWRNYVNDQLKELYPSLFLYIDIWIMLKAPSFDCVFRWRLEQETKLRAKVDRQAANENNGFNVMPETELARFVMFFQRITEQQLLTLPEKVDFLFELNDQREIQQLIQNNKI